MKCRVFRITEEGSIYFYFGNGEIQFGPSYSRCPTCRTKYPDDERDSPDWEAYIDGEPVYKLDMSGSLEDRVFEYCCEMEIVFPVTKEMKPRTVYPCNLSFSCPTLQGENDEKDDSNPHGGVFTINSLS